MEMESSYLGISPLASTASRFSGMDTRDRVMVSAHRAVPQRQFVLRPHSLSKSLQSHSCLRAMSAVLCAVLTDGRRREFLSSFCAPLSARQVRERFKLREVQRPTTVANTGSIG